MLCYGMLCFALVCFAMLSFLFAREQRGKSNHCIVTLHLDRMRDARSEHVGLAALHCNLVGLAAQYLDRMEAVRFEHETVQIVNEMQVRK